MMQRGRHIVDILRDTQAGIPRLIDASVLSPPRGKISSSFSVKDNFPDISQILLEAWEAAWIPLLSVYAQLCLNPSRELRQVAIGSLQRTLLAPEILANSDVDLSIIFERVFFPMLEELLKPQVFRRDPAGMSETRLRASALLCKIFLQYLTQLTTRQGMSHLMDLWLKILGYQDRFMHSGRRDQMVSLGFLPLRRLPGPWLTPPAHFFFSLVRSRSRVAQERSPCDECFGIPTASVRGTVRGASGVVGCDF